MYISKELYDFNQKNTLSWENFLPAKTPSEKEKWRSPVYEIIHQVTLPNIESIKKQDFDEWRLSLSDSGLSTKTTNAHMITMRSWLKFLKKQGVDCIDPTTLDLIKAEDREVTFLTNDEIINFFKSITTDTIQ